jgi:hypothetical protein
MIDIVLVVNLQGSMRMMFLTCVAEGQGRCCAAKKVQTCARTRPLVEKSPLVPVGEGLLYRFPNRYRPIGTKGQDLLYRFVTNRYKRPSTWARRGDREQRPLVPVCDTNRY